MYMHRISNLRRFAATTLLPMALILSVALFLLVVNDRLPEQVATHWGADGAADGFTDRGSLPWWTTAISLGIVLPLALISHRLSPQSFVPTVLHGLPAGVAGFIAAMVVFSTWVQLDGGDGGLQTWVLPASIAVGLGFAGIASLIAGTPNAAPTTTAPAPADADRYPLDDEQTAVWSGRTATGRMLPVLLACIVIMHTVNAAFTSWWLLAIAAPVVLVVLASTSFDVTAGPAGVRVAGMLGFPRITVPLPEITEASASTVKASSFGGWGLRVRKGATAVLTRSGPALTLTRTDGAMLHVTLDDPEKPAALISTLLDRRS